MTPTEYAEAVAAEVRAELGRHRKSATELAKVLDISPQTVGRRLNGETPFDVSELVKISDWLGISVSVLAVPRRTEPAA